MTIKTGIAGFGVQGRTHARALQKLSEEGVCNLVAIADPDEAARVQASKISNCRIFDRYDAMLAEADLDLVIIATHVPLHHDQTIAAVGRSIHVLCEKPMASTLAEADAMVGAAGQAGVYLSVCFQGVFMDAVQAAKRMVARGKIGDLYRMEATGKGRPAPYDLEEVGCHMLNLMLHFGGRDVKSVFGRVVTKDKRLAVKGDARPMREIFPKGRPLGMGVPGYLEGHYVFESGVCGTIWLFEYAERDDGRLSLTLYGTKGRLRIHESFTGCLLFNPLPCDAFDHDLAVPAYPKWETVAGTWDRDPEWKVPMRRIIEDMAVAIREGRPPAVTGADARTVVEMTQGIYASHLAGSALPFPLADRVHPFVSAP